MSGILSVDMPAVLQGFNKISPTPYAAGILAVKEFKGLKFTCSPSEGIVMQDGSTVCPISTGEEALVVYNFSDFNLNEAYIILPVLFFSYRLLAYAVMKFKLSRRSHF